MPSFPVVSRQFEFVSPPVAGQLSVPGGVGAITVAAVTPQAMDLQALMAPTLDITNAQSTPNAGGKKGATEAYLTVEADAADIGLIFGPTLASVSGGNAPVLATVAALVANAYPATAGVCYRIPTGQERRFRINAAQHRFMGFVGGGAGTIRFYQSSPPVEGV